MNATQFFFELTPERVLDSVEAGGYRVTGRCSALGSYENRVYDLELEPTDENPRSRVVAKFYRPGRWTETQIQEEHQFISDLMAAEIPTAMPLPFPDGRTLKKTDQGDIWYAVFERVGGRPSVELGDEQTEILGRLLARMHGVGEQRLAPNRITLDENTYGRASLEILNAGNWLPASLAQTYVATAERIFALYRQRLDALHLPKLSRIHGDCHPGNLLWGSKGPFFLDFDDLVRGPSVQDIWLLVPGRDAEAKAQRELLLDAYEAMRPFHRGELKLIEPLRGLRILRFSAWIAHRWEDPAFPQAFPQFGTDSYWREELQNLQQVVEACENDSAPIYT